MYLLFHRLLTSFNPILFIQVARINGSQPGVVS